MKKSTKRFALAAIICVAVLSFALAIAPLAKTANADNTVTQAVVKTSPEYLTDGSAELIKNGDFSITNWDDENNGWKNQGWGELDATNRGKITYSWLLEMVADLPIGLYHDVAVEKNTDYYLVFHAAQTKLKEGRSLTVGLSDPSAVIDGTTDTDWTSYLDGQKVEISNITADGSVYYVAFNSGNLENVRIRFETQYLIPDVDCQFGGFWLDNVSFKKITGKPEYTVNSAAVSTKALYTTDGSAETVINGDFAIADFANADCGWKDQGWAGFDGGRAKITYSWLPAL